MQKAWETKGFFSGANVQLTSVHIEGWGRSLSEATEVKMEARSEIYSKNYVYGEFALF